MNTHRSKMHLVVELEVRGLIRGSVSFPALNLVGKDEFVQGGARKLCTPLR